MTSEDQINLILSDILSFHEEMENDEGVIVEQGIRDYGLLESAVSAPFQTFFGEDLYNTVEEKAAHLCYGLANNHPFIDGNKRIAIHSMEVLLILNGLDIECSQNELYELGMKIARDEIKPDDIVDWIHGHKIKCSHDF